MAAGKGRKPFPAVSTTTKKEQTPLHGGVLRTPRSTVFRPTKTMNTKDLIRLGVPLGEPLKLAHEFIQNFIAQGGDGARLEDEIFDIVANPPDVFRRSAARAAGRAILSPGLHAARGTRAVASVGRRASKPRR